MRARKKQVHYREAENDDGKIKNAKLRGARSAPAGIAGKPQVKNVSDKNQQRDDIFGIVVPDVAGKAVNPEKTERCADPNRNEADEDAALTHAIEKVERRKAPDDVRDAMFVEEALFGEVDNTEHAGKAEGSIGEDAKGHVESEGDAGGGRGGEVVGRREVGEKKKC